MSTEPTPGEVRPRRTLDRPPSDRYASARLGGSPTEGEGGGPGTRFRAGGPKAALGVAAAGAIAILVLNVVLAISTGLLAVAAVIGYLVGQALHGSGGHGTGSHGTGGAEAGGAGTRSGLAIGLAVASVVAGVGATWIASLAQGGVLGPVDYLAQAMGPLLPGQVAVAAIGAWLASR